MRAVSPLALRLGISASLAFTVVVVSSACTPPSAQQPKAAAKPAKKPPAKKRPPPKDAWLDEVVSKAEVTVTSADGKKQVCAWNDAKKRHLCEGQANWIYVGPQVLKVANNEAYCVWQHPLSEGTVTTKLKGVAKQALQLEHAFTGNAANLRNAAGMNLQVKVDGDERTKLRLERKPGFERARIEAAKAGGNGDIELTVSTEHAGAAHYCWRIKGVADNEAAAPPAPGAAPSLEVKEAAASKGPGTTKAAEPVAAPKGAAPKAAAPGPAKDAPKPAAAAPTKSGG